MPRRWITAGVGKEFVPRGRVRGDEDLRLEHPRALLSVKASVDHRLHTVLGRAYREFAMRRFVPWALLVLLVLGTAVGVGLGVAEQPGAIVASLLGGLLA
jgi:hypothetical protein